MAEVDLARGAVAKNPLARSPLMPTTFASVPASAYICPVLVVIAFVLAILWVAGVVTLGLALK